MPYFEVIPIGETINAVKIIGRSKVQINNNPRHESVYECQCTLCGKTIYRLVSMIITGALQPCRQCRAKYKMVDFNKRNEELQQDLD